MARNRDHSVTDIVDDVTGNTGFVALGAFVVALVAGVAMHNGELSRRMKKEEEMMQEHAPEIADKILEKGETLKQPPRDVAVKGSPSKGPDDADIVIVEFGDFECPHCQKLWNSVEEYTRTTDRKVKLHFANFPLNDACNPMATDLHPHACAAAVAGVCAQRQDRFWEYGQLLFDNQKALDTDDLVQYAKDVDMDIAAFQSCLDDPDAMTQVKYDIGQAMKLDVRATPTFFVNGYPVTGAFPVPILSAIIDKIAAHEP
jgi:protein-disulfide isomerase